MMSCDEAECSSADTRSIIGRGESKVLYPMGGAKCCYGKRESATGLFQVGKSEGTSSRLSSLEGSMLTKLICRGEALAAVLELDK